MSAPRPRRRELRILRFHKVQELAQRKNAEYFENLGRFRHLKTTENILKGLIYCADCKRPLVRYKNVSHEKKLWYTFICQTHTNDITSCPKKNIREGRQADA